MIDEVEDWPLDSWRVIHHGHIATFAEEVVISPSGESLRREMLLHPGSVAVLALNDANRIAVVHQFRAAVGMRLVEPPAGLLDVAGEAPLAAAKRELAEEAGLAAADWRVLVDYCPSPGISDEVARIFLARRLSPTPRPDGFAAHGEEADMGLTWLHIDDALAQVRAGQLHNGALVLGVIALSLARLEGTVDDLPPGDAPWPQRERVSNLKNQRHG